MDPQATWNTLLEEWAKRNWLEISELAEVLLEWMNKGGFPPETLGNRQLGLDWHHELAKSMCEFALERANDVLDSPNRIPSQVPFILTCAHCNNEGPDTFEGASEAGWSRIEYVPASTSENFLGTCPICLADDS